jgi:phosphoribosylglycinamide formyltransferase 1
VSVAQRGDAVRGLRVGVLASGTGTNLSALIDAVHGRDGIAIVAVGSDKPDAPALDRARAADIPVRSFPAAEFAGDRAARDAALAAWLVGEGVDLLVLAGYMQILGADFIARFPDRVINVHPALLPAFPGLDAVGQALAYGVKIFGVTVHFVDAGVDSGAIIAQEAVALPDAHDREDVFSVLHEIEHRLLPHAVRLFAAGALQRDPEHPRRILVQSQPATPRR